MSLFFKTKTDGELLYEKCKKLATNTLKWSIKNLKDIYRDCWDYIIQNELNNQFILDTYKDLCILTTKELNLLKRVIDEISNVYLAPAERKAVTGVEKKGEKEEDVFDERYDEILKETQIDVVSKAWNTYTNLTNNILVRPLWRSGKMEYDILTLDNAEILTDDDDWKKIIAVKYYLGYELPFYDAFADSVSGATGRFNDYTIPRDATTNMDCDYSYSYLWTLENKNKETGEYTESKIYKYEKSGDEEKLISVEENPYKDKDGNPILPFVLFLKTYPIDKLLDFSTGSDLVDITISTAINLVHLNTLTKFSAWKQKYIITNDPESIPDKLALAIQRVAVLPKGKEQSVEIGTWDQESDLNKFLEVILTRAKVVLAQYGIDAESFTRSGNAAESGYKLKVRKEGLLERREDQIELYRDYERKVFEITRIVNNHHSNSRVDENAEFKIDFADPKFESDAASENANWTVQIANNVKTPIDWIKSENPDLDEEEAKVVFEKNKAVNGSNLGNIPIKPLERKNDKTNNKR